MGILFLIKQSHFFQQDLQKPFSCLFPLLILLRALTSYVLISSKYFEDLSVYLVQNNPGVGQRFAWLSNCGQKFIYGGVDWPRFLKDMNTIIEVIIVYLLTFIYIRPVVYYIVSCLWMPEMFKLFSRVKLSYLVKYIESVYMLLIF